MVRHDRRQLLTNEKEEDGDTLLDEKTLKESITLERSAEETYFKFRGEEILKNSGLRYVILVEWERCCILMFFFLIVSSMLGLDF